jgi:phospholipid/cholesterol/gamma-HCH transport system ATP-binding protein
MRSGATTIMVTHDVQESLLIVDYIYFRFGRAHRRARHAGRDPRLEGSLRASVRHAEADGPVHFHYPAPPSSTVPDEGARG